MKRRSARPFVVEIKNPPRPGRTATQAFAGPVHAESSLWRGLLAGAEAAPAAKPPARSAPPSPDSQSGMPAPVARRILPNLMPLHAPDATLEHATPVAAPATRRRGPARTKQPSALSAKPNVTAPKPMPIVTPAPLPIPDPHSDATGTVALPPTPAGRPKPAQRRPEGLRPGERWKRRLSRFSR